MSLLILPNELIIKVISYTEFSGLISLIKTCHLLYSLATPYLYSEINNQRFKFLDFKWAHLFLRTILDRPDLAKLTKVLKCQEGTCEEVNFPPDAISLAAWDSIQIKIMKASSEKKHADFGYQLIRDVDCADANHYIDALVAVIVCFLPNLEELYMFDWHKGRHRIFHSLFERATALQVKRGSSDRDVSPYSMSKLTCIRMERYYDNHEYSHTVTFLSEILPALQLPSTKKFIGELIFDECIFNGDDSYQIPESFTSNVEDLRFGNGCLGSKSMRDFLGSCPSLRRFSLRHSCYPNETISAALMVEGLMASKETLEFVEVGMDHYSRTWWPGQPRFSFVDFPNLRELAIDKDMILDDATEDEDVDTEGECLTVGPGGVGMEVWTDKEKDAQTDYTKHFLQRIPRSVESLRLKECLYVVDIEIEAVIALIRRKEKFAPDLKYLRLDYIAIVPRYETEQRIGINLMKECKKSGIKLTLVN